ncbi:MAG: DUF1569 domain-containing protein [Bacteroidota bacterium]|nr:DUF1569 domain-containing protein [Bacteroidota bacterium]
MESLFKQEVAQKYINRINNLSNRSASQWGKMNVGQMLTHCQKPILIATGDLIPTVNPLLKFLFGKSAKKQAVGDKEFKKNLPTFKEAIIVDQRVFDSEKNKLISLIETYQQKGEAGLTKNSHPFFGEMSVSDWNALQVKHLDHHLKQFGA